MSRPTPFKVMIIQVISYKIYVQYIMQHGPNVKLTTKRWKQIKIISDT